VSSPQPASRLSRITSCFRAGLTKGLRSAAWLLTLMVPISLVVRLLDWAGILPWLAKWLEPGFRLVGLPGEAAVPFLTAAFVNIYSGIAAMEPIGLDDRQVTILALAILVCHNLPVEGPIQHRVGSSWVRMVALRLTMSVAASVVLNAVLPPGSAVAAVSGAGSTAAPTLGAVLQAWAFGASRLIGKVVVLVICLMILQQILTEFRLIRPLARLLSPLLRILGLPQRTAFLWIVANALGLAFGAAVIFEEVESGALTKEEVEILNRSVAVCHSLLEDSLLFVAVGAWAFWIIAPRLVLAAVAVWLYRIGRRLAGPGKADPAAAA